MGNTWDILEYRKRDTRIFDVVGRRVVPGFTDSHVHYSRGSISLLEADLHDAGGKLEFQNTIRKKNGELGDSEWMTGGGWHNGTWDPDTLPDRSWIDDVCPHRPVYLVKQDMHMALANGKALELAGIGENSPDPEGGRIDRWPESGKPTGILREAAMRIVESVTPPQGLSLIHI